MQWLHVPGFVRDVEFHDAVTGYNISVTTGDLFTRITINGRDFYFRRTDGHYDGAGFAGLWAKAPVGSGSEPTPYRR
jgi:hypothetical protein